MHANLLLALRPEVRDTVCLMCACKPVAGSEARGQGYCVFNVCMQLWLKAILHGKKTNNVAMEIMSAWNSMGAIFLPA